MTTRPTVSRAQLDALEGAQDGRLRRPDTREEYWRIERRNGTSIPATPSARTLVARGLVAELAVEWFNPITFEIERVIYAQVTEAGRALLVDFASREPTPKETQ